MGKQLLFLMLFVGGSSFAQFNLEHTYDQGEPVRVKFDYSGEKYFVFATIA